MINNIQNIFSEYSNKISTKKELENKIIFYFKNEFKIDLEKNNLNIDIKRKEIKIINIKSSIKFFINNTITEEKKEIFKKETGFQLNFN